MGLLSKHGAFFVRHEFIQFHGKEPLVELEVNRSAQIEIGGDLNWNMRSQNIHGDSFLVHSLAHFFEILKILWVI